VAPDAGQAFVVSLTKFSHPLRRLFGR
jgi:hypothetical protein